MIETQEIKQGDMIQFRKVGGVDAAFGIEHHWRNGTLEGDTGRCWKIRTAGVVNDYWKHRIEIRKLTN